MSDRSQIFFSYAREDEPDVRALYQWLVQSGFTPWMDTQNLLPGQKWSAEIMRALKHSALVLVCLSQRSVRKRGFMQREIRKALENLQEKLDTDIYLIPVRLDDCEIPESLSEIQWVNLFDKGGRAHLLKAIEFGLEQAKELARPSREAEAVYTPELQSMGLRITAPSNHSKVPHRPYVEGTTTARRTTVWLVIHPLDVSGYWVQSPASISEDGSWGVYAFIGQAGPRDAGKRFEVRACCRPEIELAEGMVLGQWPESKWKSEVIEVIRAQDAERGPGDVGSRTVFVEGNVVNDIIITGDQNIVKSPRPFLKNSGKKK